METQQQEWKNTTSHSKAYWATVRGPWWRLAPASPWRIPRDGHGKVERRAPRLIQGAAEAAKQGWLSGETLEKRDRAVSNSNTPEDMGALKVLGLDQIPPLTPPTIWGLQAGDIGQCGPQCPRKGKGRWQGS